MTIRTLYRYVKPNGEVVVSPREPEPGVEYTTKVRLIADEGMAITNGTIVTTCIDTDTADGWTDCDLEVQEDEESVE